jgi:hypothetical protein
MGRAVQDLIRVPRSANVGRKLGREKLVHGAMHQRDRRLVRRVLTEILSSMLVDVATNTAIIACGAAVVDVVGHGARWPRREGKDEMGSLRQYLRRAFLLEMNCKAIIPLEITALIGALYVTAKFLRCCCRFATNSIDSALVMVSLTLRHGSMQTVRGTGVVLYLYIEHLPSTDPSTGTDTGRQ